MGIYESGEGGSVSAIYYAGSFIFRQAFLAADIGNLSVFYTYGLGIRVFPVHGIYFSVYNRIHVSRLLLYHLQYFFITGLAVLLVVIQLYQLIIRLLGYRVSHGDYEAY